MSRSQGVQALLLGGIAVAIALQYGVLEHPLIEDRAFFVYLGQQLLRGEPIYQTTFFGYPPTGALASAAAMLLGTALGLPSYLAPRVVSAMLPFVYVACFFVFARRALGSAWAAALGAIVLASFAQLGRFAVGTLEPKAVVLLLEILAMLALQRRRFGWAGLASTLAATCWQPAGLIAIVSFAVVLHAGRHRLGESVLAFVGGCIAGLLPTIAYVTFFDSWGDFLQRAFLFHLHHRVPRPGTLYWVGASVRDYGNEALFLALGLLGFGAWLVRQIRRRRLVLPHTWLSPRLAGAPLATAAWMVWNSIEFTGPLDLFTLLPLVALWVAWLARRVALACSLRAPVRRAAGGVLLVAALAYGAADAVLYTPALELDEQSRVMRELREQAGERPVLGFGAEEFYALEERPSPLPFVHLNLVFDHLLPLVESGGCPGLTTRVLRQPGIVVADVGLFQGACVRRIEKVLADHGYGMRTLTFEKREHWHFRPRPEDVQRIEWHVYAPPDPAPGRDGEASSVPR